MINKRRAIPLIVVIFLVCIVLALGLYHVFTSFDIKRSEDIVGAINVTTTGSSENIPLATSNNGDFSGIFFQEAEYNKLIILKKNWMTGRYSCWGTASTLSTVGTYQSVDSHNRIVVVYTGESSGTSESFSKPADAGEQVNISYCLSYHAPSLKICKQLRDNQAASLLSNGKMKYI